MDLLIVLAISIVSIAMGLFLFFKPFLAIELQKRFYRLINWRIEPVSMQKEIRNTKLMGLFLIVVTLFALIYKLFCR